MNIGLWFHCALKCLEKIGVVQGPMYRTAAGKGKFKKASVGYIGPLFIGILQRVQIEQAGIILDTVDVQNEYGMSRSLRRGATSEAQNAQIPQEVVEANNRWRKHCRSRGITPGMSMMEWYTDAKASILSLIQFSGSLSLDTANNDVP